MYNIVGDILNQELFVNKNLIKMSKVNSSKYDLIKNSIVIGVMTLISRITGLIRDMCLAHFVGSSRTADLFLIALRVPNTFRAIFADGAFNNTFIPLLSKIRETDDKTQLKQFIKDILSILFYVLLIFTLITLIFMPVIVTIFAGSIQNKEVFNNLIMICRITFPFLLFISIARFFSGLLEIQNKFCLSAFSPIITNIFSILGIMFAGYYSLNIAIWGAVAFSTGGLIQAYILFHANIKNGFGIVPHPIFTFYRNINNIFHKKNTKIFTKNIIPGILSGGIYNINIMISTFFASGITGAISWIYYAERFVQLPLGIVGIAIGTVLLPKLSAANSDTEIENYFNKACKYVLFLMIPIVIGLIIIGNLLIDLIYKSGTFNITDVNNVNKALIILSTSLPFLALNRYISIVFYAKHDTKTPMKIAFYSAIFNTICSYILVNTFGFLGVTFASTLITIINFLMLYFVMHKRQRIKIHISTVKFCIGILIASAIMAIAVFYLKLNINESWNDFSTFKKIVQICKISGIGAITYMIVFVLLFAENKFSKLKI